MRDPKRIPRMLKLLRLYWEASPDLRLGQIIGNFTPRYSVRLPGDSYNVEDTIIEEALEKALKS